MANFGFVSRALISFKIFPKSSYFHAKVHAELEFDKIRNNEETFINLTCLACI